MNKVIAVTLFLIITVSAPAQVDESLVENEANIFQQVSDHCYVLNIEENGENIAIVSTEQGVLLFDPPPEPDLSIVVEALKNLTGSPVRWMIHTGYYASQTVGDDYYTRQGAVLLSGFRQQASPVSVPELSDDPISAFDWDFYDDQDRGRFAYPGQAERDMVYPEFPDREMPALLEFTFKNRMYLYPDDVEIEIRELPHEARTSADIFTYVPAEKVLFVGRFFIPEYYPDIDVSAGGSALKWIDALEQVIDSVPLLISAIPPEEPEEEEGIENSEKEETVEGEESLEGEMLAGDEEEEEKTLEEMISVISARGEVSNLMDMKDMLDTSKKLRNQISRAVKAGKSCESYLDSSSANPYLIYGNFFTYAEQLCRELAPEVEDTNLNTEEP